ncbi:MAG: SAM-dependent methyltransferase [Patescibacteria group bacterium]|nr:SAM-dependent methyltransferase [Patescibacteria group bacterium]
MPTKHKTTSISSASKNMQSSSEISNPASYKDPSGFIYTKDGKIFRQVNLFYKENYDSLMQSGLYKKLVEKKYLITHKEISNSPKNSLAYKIIAPEIIPFISYPYEWCFSQLKDTALLTLLIQKTALSFDMSLKDATSFNIQFLPDGKPIFIDTLSFEKYVEGQPWVAYRQFCEQFLSPLAVVAYRDFRLAKLLQDYLGNIPLDLAAKLLPLSAKMNLSLFMHISLHARSQKKYSSIPLSEKGERSLSKQSLLGILDSLESTIRGMKWQDVKSTWSHYYEGDTKGSYHSDAFDKKKKIVAKYLKTIHPKTLWDIGANAGMFSRIASEMGIYTISMDYDYPAVEKNYILMKKNNEKNILPLWIDITNPTPALGWVNLEREPLIFGRPRPDMVMALALIHHLVMTHNIPLSLLASFFSEICQSLIIEFVPKGDNRVKLLLQNREDVFSDYNQEHFEKEFWHYFTIREKTVIPQSQRIIYLMLKKD